MDEDASEERLEEILEMRRRMSEEENRRAEEERKAEEERIRKERENLAREALGLAPLPEDEVKTEGSEAADPSVSEENEENK